MKIKAKIMDKEAVARAIVRIAHEIIEKNKGTLYDTDVVDTCLKLFHEKGFKF